MERKGKEIPLTTFGNKKLEVTVGKTPAEPFFPSKALIQLQNKLHARLGSNKYQTVLLLIHITVNIV